MLSRLKNITKFFLGVPLTIISLYFIFSFIYSNKEEILPRLSDMSPLPFVVGIIFLMIFFFLRSYAWKSILESEGHKIETEKAIYLLAAAEIKRYIPGSVLGFISRINSFGRFGLNSKTIFKMIIYESVIFLFTSIIVSIPGISYVLSRTGVFPPIYLVAFALLGLITTAVIVAITYRFIKKYSSNISLLLQRIPQFTNSIILMIAAWIFFGIGNYLIGISFFYLDPAKITELSSFFVLSWLIGYVVVVVPLGLGVREAAVVYGLSNLMSAGFAAVIAILLRIGLIVAELLFLIAAYIFYRFSFLKTKASWEKIILWSSIFSYTLYFSYYSIQKHLNFFTGRFDLGNMDQTVWNSLHGNVFMLTNPNGTEIISRLAIHADFILILLAPFYIIWEDPRTLLIIQTVVLAIGAYFVYKITQTLLPRFNYLPLAFSISYLLNPWVQKQNLFDFHAVTLATTFLLASFYFALIQKYRLFFVFLILALLTKENVYLVGVVFGLYLTFNTKNKVWLLLSAASGIMFYVLVTKFMPGARGSTHFALEFFGEFGDSFNEIIATLIFNPALPIAKLLTLDSLTYITNILLPVGFLSILAPFYLFFALPDLAINLLSQNPNFRSITFHYAAVIIPFTYIAAIFAVRNLLKMKRLRANYNLLVVFIIAFSLFSTYKNGVLPGSQNPSLEIYSRYLAERHDIKNFLDNIPQDLKVAATNNLGAHVSQREYVYTLPVGIAEADVVVMLLNNGSDFKQTVNDLRYNEEYIEIYKIGDFIAFAKRKSAHQISPGY